DIPENLYPELPGPEDTIVDFPEGKVDVYTRSDGIPISVPTVVPQGLAILLTDTQTRRSEDKVSPRLLRSKSLPPMYNLDWP
ncbi:hypothetical protein Tco_0653572, partial [Tanacetum coccineum]